MEFKYVLFEVRDRIARITLNSPGTLNAYHEAMLSELCAAVQQAREDEEVRVLILTGAGKAFCSGGDVSGSKESVTRFHQQKMGYLLEMREGMHQAVLALTRLDKPLIAAVNGAAVAGGLTLALCCDLRIASERARLGDTAVRFGLLPDEGGAYLFPRFMGLDRALRMSMLGEVYDAPAAMALGLVTEVVAHDRLYPRVDEIAGRLAEGPPLAIRLAKRMMYKQREMTLVNALEDAALSVMITNPSQDAREGIQAFLKKRKPQFKGR